MNKKAPQITGKKNRPTTPSEQIHINQQKSKPTPLSFKSIQIQSDSHGRLLSGLVKELVGTRTVVSGVVKPGAKLLDVVSNLPPPRDSCTVLIAGTNDLAAGQQFTIYQHLEQKVVAKLRTSKVVISTLPHRHDLPAHHPVNTQTELVNRHIKELVAKFDGAELVDFNSIGRRLFTSHGMHLRLAGKRLLARLVLNSLVKVDIPSRSTAWSLSATGPSSASGPASAAGPPTADGPPSAVRPPSAASIQESEPPLETVICLPFENYAEAVKRASPQPRGNTVEASSASPKNRYFLVNVTGKQGHQCQP